MELFCRRVTRVSKIPIFPKLETFAELQNWIRFSKFQMPYGSFFRAVHKKALAIEFREVSFLAIFKRLSGLWPRKFFCNITFCTDPLAIQNCAFGSFLAMCVPSCMRARIRRDNHRFSPLQLNVAGGSPPPPPAAGQHTAGLTGPAATSVLQKSWPAHPRQDPAGAVVVVVGSGSSGGGGKR